jgi:zinc protease
MQKHVKIFLILISFIFLCSNLFATNEIGTINNLKYAIYNFKDSDINSINVLIRAGSIFDPKGKYGLAYIVSNLLKRGGTKKYPPNKLLNKLDATGIELSTGCSKDFIFLSMKFLKKNSKEALNIFKEILLNPSFNKNEFLSLKKETIATINSYQNNYDYVALHNGAVKLINNTEYSHSSFGIKRDIEKITLKDVADFYKKNFIPEKTIVTFAGDYNIGFIKRFLKNNFKTKTNYKKQRELNPVFNKKGGKYFIEKNVHQAYIYFLFPSYGLKSNEYYNLRILSFVLGGNLTSILAEKIRKEQGLAYSVFSTNYSMVNGGFFIIGMQTKNSQKDKTIKSVINILKNLKINGIPEKKITLAKNFITGAIPISLQSISSIAASISSGIYLNKPIPPWEYDIKMIKKVSKSNIDTVIKKIFNFNKMVISVVGKK